MPRILTYNIHRCVGVDRKLDVGRVAATIAALEPDIVALQDQYVCFALALTVFRKQIEATQTDADVDPSPLGTRRSTLPVSGIAFASSGLQKA